jgi:hypothetical protein
MLTEAASGFCYGRLGLTVASVALLAAPLHAADSDLSTTIISPTEAYLGQTITVTVGYANAGPETAASAYVNAYIPSGVPARVGELTQEQWDALEATAIGTDSLGNWPHLFEDDSYCEHLLFQVQRGENDSGSVVGLDPGVTASFSFQLEIPMEPPRFGRVTITEPPELAQMWRPAVAGREFIDAARFDRYSRGGCEIDSYPDLDCAEVVREPAWCFGNRVSNIDPIDARLELVNDGSANPTLGCLPFTITPGRIALIRRGECQFGVKGFNAELGGATAAILVNDGRCGNFPDSDQCVLNMYDWGSFSIPMVMVAQADGEPIIAALESGETVRGIIGPQNDPMLVNSLVFLLDEADHDPDPLNDRAEINVTIVPQVLEPPTASFTFEPALPVSGMPVLFTDTSMFAPDEWSWDFGDGSPGSTEQHPSHTYTVAGTYTVSLMVSNQLGSDATNTEVVVNPSGVRNPGGRRVAPDGI